MDMNQPWHMIGGVVAGIIGAYKLNQEGVFLGLLVFVLIFISFVISFVPDILDTPISPAHRDFFHSYIILGGLFFTWYELFEGIVSGSIGNNIYFYFAILGYLSHLILDLPNLPIISRHLV